MHKQIALLGAMAAAVFSKPSRKDEEEVALRPRLRDIRIPYYSFEQSFTNGITANKVNRRNELAVPVVVPAAFVDKQPELHVFNIKGVEIKAKDRKTAIKIYNLHH